MLGLLACSDDTDPAQASSEVHAEPTTASIAIVAQPLPEVLDIFNVGNTVYVRSLADNEIGIVTSGTMSPSLKKGIGLGYVKKEHSKRDNKIFIQIRNKSIPATIVRLPFYKG